MTAIFQFYSFPEMIRTIQVKVKPKARTSSVEQLADGTWLARIKSPPVDGKANRELVSMIAAHFGVRQAQVSMKSGAAGRLKFVQIKDAWSACTTEYNNIRSQTMSGMVQQAAILEIQV